MTLIKFSPEFKSLPGIKDKALERIRNIEHVYHAVPAPMFGTELHPLNTLRTLHPEAYAGAAKKYEWRKSFLELRIPKLECLWNDVLHFSIVHPHHVQEALTAAGRRDIPSILFYEIPLESVLSLPHAVYHTPAPVLHETTFSLDLQAPAHVINPALVELPGEYSLLYPNFPAATRDYFRFELSRERRPLLFNGLPHFLLHSSLDIKSIRHIDWLDPIAD